MNKTKYLIGSAALIASLLMASPALADEGFSGGDSVNVGFHLGTLVQTFDKDRDGDRDGNKVATVGSTSVAAGTVSSVNGSTFVVSAIRSGKATTTVTTDSSTVFKVNGSATTSAALTPGARVIVVGTTTATSTSGNTVEASLVVILTKFVGFWKHWMGMH